MCQNPFFFPTQFKVGFFGFKNQLLPQFFFCCALSLTVFVMGNSSSNDVKEADNVQVTTENGGLHILDLHGSEALYVLAILIVLILLYLYFRRKRNRGGAHGPLAVGMAPMVSLPPQPPPPPYSIVIEEPFKNGLIEEDRPKLMMTREETKMVRKTPNVRFHPYNN